MKNKILLFITLTYLISWAVALLMVILNIPYGSVQSYIIIGGLYMTAPAFVTIFLQKAIYKESLSSYGLNKKGLNLTRILLPFLLLWGFIGVYFLLIFLAGNIVELPLIGKIDFSDQSVLHALNTFIQNQTGNESFTPTQSLPLPAYLLFFLILLQGSIMGGIVNFPFALGEELGWRGLLQTETRHWGYIKSNLFIGIVWGLWHAPIIALGHNFPGYPVWGIGMMILFSIALSFLLGYVRAKTESIIAPTLFHGGLNAVALGVGLFIQDNHPLVGSLAGIVGIVAIMLLTVFLLLKNKTFIKNFSRFT